MVLQLSFILNMSPIKLAVILIGSLVKNLLTQYIIEKKNLSDQLIKNVLT